jgi:sRNA-binding protein
MSQSHNQAVTAVIALLAETFPKCFAIYEGRRRAITPAELHKALGVYCSNPAYLEHTRTGAWRLDLDGNPAL